MPQQPPPPARFAEPDDAHRLLELFDQMEVARHAAVSADDSRIAMLNSRIATIDPGSDVFVHKLDSGVFTVPRDPLSASAIASVEATAKTTLMAFREICDQVKSLARRLTPAAKAHQVAWEPVIDFVTGWNVSLRDQAHARATMLADLSGRPTTQRGNESDGDGDGGRRRGRLTRDDAKVKRASLLATLREHPSLKDDPPKLADMIGIGESTVRRWIKDEERQYLESPAAQPKKK